MKDKIFEFFNTQFPFNTEGLGEFVSSFEYKHFPKGTTLLAEGQLETQLRFLEKGIIRDYFAHKGKERNTEFYVKPAFITDFNALAKGLPSQKNQESPC